MSVRVMTLVWALDLPDSQKIVLLALADSANDEGHCWPSMASLARKCSKGERTVQGVIKELVEAGHLTRREVPGKGCNYTVHPRKDCAPQAPHPRRDCATPPQRLRHTPAAAADKPSRNHQEPSSSSAPDGALRAEHVIEFWNKLAPSMNKRTVRDLTPERRQLVNARISQNTLERFQEVFGNLRTSSWFPEAKGCQFDWVMKKANFQKILEGNYNG